MSQPRSWIAAVVVAAALLPSPARADRKNEIHAVTFDEDAGTTRVHVQGAQTPTFTVYKLERPSRVVIDVPQARLVESLRGHESAAVFTANTWAVSTIAAQELDDGGLVVRVIVTLARPGRYDVKTVGNDLVVAVMPRDPAPRTASPEALAAAQAEREQARQAAQAAERGRAQAEQSSAVAMAEAAKAKDIAAAVQAQAVKTRQDAVREIEAATRTKAEAEAAKQAASRDAEAVKQAAAREAATAKQELARTKTEAEAAKQAASRDAEAARQAAAVANQDVTRLKAEAETAKQDAARNRALAEATRAAAQQQLDAANRAKADVDAARREAEVAKAEAARTQAAALAAKDDVARTKAEAEAAKAEAARTQAAVLAAKDDVARTKAEAAAARSEADKASALARAIRAEAEAAKAETTQRKAEAEAAKTQSTRNEAELLAARQKTQVAEHDAAQKQAELLAARQKAEVADRDAAQKRAEATAAQVDAAKMKDDNVRVHAEASRARSEAEAAKAEVARMRAEAEQALARIKAQKTAVELAATQPAAATAIKLGVATSPTAAPLAGMLAVLTAGKPGAATPSGATAAGTSAAATNKASVATLPATVATVTLLAGTPAVTTAGKPGVATPPAGAATTAPVAAKPTKPTPLAQVRDIAFTGDDATGRVTIALTGDATVTLGEVTQTAAELIIDHAQLAPKLERKLDVSQFGGPVRAVSSFRDRRTPDRVRLIAELSSPATPTFDRGAGVVRWSFARADLAKRPVTARPALVRTRDVPSPVVGGFGAASTPVAQQTVSQLPPQGSRQRVYHGQTVDVHLKDAPIRDLLRLIADTGKVSIVVPDTIDARVTLDLTRVPWDQALEVILSSHQLWYRREGNLYRIAPRKELDAEDEAEAARREAALKAEAPRPQLVPLNYSSAADLAKKLEPMLSPHGKIAVDERTNQLIVTDVAGNREQIARLALSLDTQTPQISIEARIVEANSTFLRQIGVQWGGRALAGATSGNATGLVWPSSISVIGGNEDAQTVRTGVASPSDFAVNLPAATGSGEGGALGLSLGSVGGNFNVNLRLSALEDAGSIRIISSPKVTVLNNKLASIASGVSIPISTVSATGTQTQFVQADLRLDVTPTVSQSDCSISMNLSVSKNAPDFSQLGARGDPTIQRREARTFMLVADGETSVLGGIYTRNTSLAYKKIPFLGDLPVLGWLFKNRREQDDRTELLVFITPKITNRALLRCSK